MNNAERRQVARPTAPFEALCLDVVDEVLGDQLVNQVVTTTGGLP